MVKMRIKPGLTQKHVVLDLQKPEEHLIEYVAEKSAVSFAQKEAQKLGKDLAVVFAQDEQEAELVGIAHPTGEFERVYEEQKGVPLEFGFRVGEDVKKALEELKKVKKL